MSLVFYWTYPRRGGGGGGGTFTDPGEANVRSGTTYYFNSVLKTGTLVPPPDLTDAEISDIYDAMIDRLGAIFTTAAGYAQIDNPYNLEDNNDGVLKQGWGLAFGPGQNANLVLSNTTSLRRTFRVILTREVIAHEHDVATKEDQWKVMMADLWSVIEDFENNIALDPGTALAIYQNDSGIQPIRPDNWKLVSITADFEITYFQTP